MYNSCACDSNTTLWHKFGVELLYCVYCSSVSPAPCIPQPGRNLGVPAKRAVLTVVLQLSCNGWRAILYYAMI